MLRRTHIAPENQLVKVGVISDSMTVQNLSSSKVIISHLLADLENLLP